MSPVAVVTGGSSGIGAATALALARDGFDVVLTYRSGRPAALEVVAEAERRGVRAAARELRLDALPTAVATAFAGVLDVFGRVDVLVNNAAVNRRMAVLDETAEAWNRTLMVNLTGAWICARAAAQRMIGQEQDGRIINVTSVLASAPLAGAAAYCASKAALDMLTRVLALELAPVGITVNAVSPGHVVTPMTLGPDETDPAKVVREAIPVGRPALPGEIADAIAFLASPKAAHATGSTLLVDGGLLLVSGPTVLEQSIGLPEGR